MAFQDRYEAGRLLASELREYAARPDVVVLALPRGGVPVGYEVGKALHVPLDVFIVRKLGVPSHEELAMGAIASGGARVLNQRMIHRYDVSQEIVDIITERGQKELERQEREFREGRQPLHVAGRTVILVDDGLATGASMFVAVAALKGLHPARIVVAVPVAAEEVCADLKGEVDHIYCATTPEPFLAVGQWYKNFSQVSDDDVRELLRRAAEPSTREAA